MWNPFEHQHKMVIVGVRHTTGMPPPASLRDLMGGGSKETPVTYALVHCACGAFDVRVLPGEWSLDEVRGTTAKQVADKLIEQSRAT